MSGFQKDTVVDVEEINDRIWQLLKSIDYQGNQDRFQIPVGQETDFASVPRVFVWFLPRYGRYTKAAILHDYLWNVEVPMGMSRLCQKELACEESQHSRFYLEFVVRSGGRS